MRDAMRAPWLRASSPTTGRSASTSRLRIADSRRPAATAARSRAARDRCSPARYTNDGSWRRGATSPGATSCGTSNTRTRGSAGARIDVGDRGVGRSEVDADQVARGHGSAVSTMRSAPCIATRDAGVLVVLIALVGAAASGRAARVIRGGSFELRATWRRLATRIAGTMTVGVHLPASLRDRLRRGSTTRIRCPKMQDGLFVSAGKSAIACASRMLLPLRIGVPAACRRRMHRPRVAAQRGACGRQEGAQRLLRQSHRRPARERSGRRDSLALRARRPRR